jgi:hypothetical protein
MLKPSRHPARFSIGTPCHPPTKHKESFMYRIVAAALLPLAIAGTAFAQSGTATTNTAPEGTQHSLPQQIQQKLTSQGFTNVKVVPGSYLVSANDKDGDPVTMVIGPHSMSIFTEVKDSSNQATAPSNGAATTTGPTGTGTKK